jgi:hypothetical protein
MPAWLCLSIATANVIACAVMVAWFDNHLLAVIALGCALNAGYYLRSAQAVWGTRRARVAPSQSVKE